MRTILNFLPPYFFFPSFNALACRKQIFRSLLVITGVLFFLAGNVKANENLTHHGKEFVFAFLPNHSGSENNLMHLYLTVEQETEITIEYPVGMVRDRILVSPNEAEAYEILRDVSDFNNWPNSALQGGDQNSVRVSANADFSCAIVNYSAASTGAALALPVSALNKYYVVSTFRPSREPGVDDKALFAVTAPYDSTIVKITPSALLENIAVAPGDTFQVRLDAGESFLGMSLESDPPNDLTGTIVRANYPISVINGNACAQVPVDEGDCDHLVEFAQPVQTWGKRILLPDFKERLSGSIFRVLPSQPQTTITLDGQTSLGTIDEMTFIQLDTMRTNDFDSLEFHYLTADKPVFVNQFIKSPLLSGDDSGDPSMINLPPTEQFQNTFRFATPKAPIANLPTNRITLFVHENDLGSVNLTNLESGESADVKTFFKVGDTEYLGTNRTILQSTYLTETTMPHLAFAWGYSNDNSYFLPAGGKLDFINQHQDTEAPEIRCFFNPDSMDAVLGVFWDNRPTEDLNGDGVFQPAEDLDGDGRLDEDSGIWRFEIIETPGSTFNATLQVADFTPGDTTVAFAGRLVDADTSGYVSVRVYDLSGNETIKRIDIPECTVEILAPTDGAFTLSETIDVVTAIQFDGLELDNFERVCTINGVPITGDFAAKDTLTIPYALEIGQNKILVECRYTLKDQSNGVQSIVCADSVSITRVKPIECDSLTITSPTDSIKTLDSLITIAGTVTFSGGLNVRDACFAVNLTTGDTIALALTNGAFELDMPLQTGWNEIIVTCNFTDDFGTTTSCSATLRVCRAEDFGCNINITSHAAQDTVFSDTTVVQAEIIPVGGVAPYKVNFCTVNGDTIETSGGDPFTLSTVISLLDDATTEIVVVCELEDSFGQTTTCSQTVSIFHPSQPICEITVTSHADEDTVSAPMTEVFGSVSISGGLAPYADSCTVNGQPVEVGDDGMLQIPLMLDFGDNPIEIFCEFTDALGQTTTCQKTINIYRPDPLECVISIDSPKDSLSIFANEISIEASATLTGGVAPYDSLVVINGDTATRAESGVFSQTVSLDFGWNEIIAEGAFTDSKNQQTSCADTIHVFRVDTLNCALVIESPTAGNTITGKTTEVLVRAEVTGGSQPTTGVVQITTPTGTFDAVFDAARGLYVAQVTLQDENNTITATGVFEDASGQSTSCETAVDVYCAPKIDCELTILSPADGQRFDADSAFVEVSAKIIGGVAPFDSTVTINGLVPTRHADGVFRVVIPLQDGLNDVIARGEFEDANQQTALCSTSVQIVKDGIICFITIDQPQDSLITKADSIDVSGSVEISSGITPIDSTLTINDVPIALDSDGRYSERLPLSLGKNSFIVSGLFIDSLGDTAICTDTLTVFRVLEPQCELTIITPEDSLCVLASELVVEVTAALSEGVAPYDSLITINGVTANRGADGVFRAPVALDLGFNKIKVSGTFSDAIGCETVCVDSITVQRIDALSCNLTITSPQDGAGVIEDSVLVTAQVDVFGGKAPYAFTCDINGVPATPGANGVFSAKVKLNSGDNPIQANCTIIDATGDSTSCTQSVTVNRPDDFECAVEIISPLDSMFVCSDTVLVSLISSVDPTAVEPIISQLVLNGDTLAASGDTIQVVVRNLLPEPQSNQIIAECVVTDALGRTSTASDTIVVRSDPTPVLCELDFSQHSDDSATVKGRFWDDESGIFDIEIIQLKNRNLVFEPWEPGDREVRFVSKRTGRQGGTALDLLITNGAGCTVICDPVGVKLSPDDQCEVELEFPEYDVYLRVENNGLHKITMDLNGRTIVLDATKAGDDTPGENYYIPLYGGKLIHWGEYLVEGQNHVDLKCEGPPGSYADLLIVNFPLTGAVYSDLPTSIEADESITSDPALPETFVLEQNYPNPFNPETTISFDVPSGWDEPVRLYIYNTNGQIISRLIDDQTVAAGRRKVIWNATDDYGRRVATGIYLYRLSSGGIALTRKLILAK